MTKSILTAPAWMLFIAFGVGIVLANIAAFAAAIYFIWDLDYGLYPTLQFGLTSMIWWAYPYLVGRALDEQLGINSTAHRKVLMVFALAIAINAGSVYYTEVYGPVLLVVLITVVLNTISLLAVMSFPARQLKSIEMKQAAGFVDCWRELLQFTFWPVSVWWLQPTLTFLVIEKEVLRKASASH